MIKNGLSISLPDKITIIEDAMVSKKVLKGQIKIMLKAFNIETDLLFDSLNPSSFINTMERIGKIATEIEEQRIIKEQMREEQRAIREYEKALSKAKKEEEMYQDALEKAKNELEIANDNEKEQLITKVELLEDKSKKRIF